MGIIGWVTHVMSVFRLRRWIVLLHPFTQQLTEASLVSTHPHGPEKTGHGFIWV